MYPDGITKTTPQLKTRQENVKAALINKKLGTDISPSLVSDLLTKMGLKSELHKGDMVQVAIPATRQDILHACDIIEDVGIAFGYNNIKKTHPNALTIGQQLPLNKVSDQLRFEIARCGYTEALTFALVCLSMIRKIIQLCICSVRVKTLVTNYVKRMVVTWLSKYPIQKLLISRLGEQY